MAVNCCDFDGDLGADCHGAARLAMTARQRRAVRPPLGGGCRHSRLGERKRVASLPPSALRADTSLSEGGEERRIPTPVTAGHTGPALQGAAVIRADRVVRPYKAEQEPCKYGKAPLQLCRRGALAYTQSSMLLRSTATSKGAAVASLI